MLVCPPLSCALSRTCHFTLIHQYYVSSVMIQLKILMSINVFKVSEWLSLSLFFPYLPSFSKAFTCYTEARVGIKWFKTSIGIGRYLQHKLEGPNIGLSVRRKVRNWFVVTSVSSHYLAPFIPSWWPSYLHITKLCLPSTFNMLSSKLNKIKLLIYLNSNFES